MDDVDEMLQRANDGAHAVGSALLPHTVLKKQALTTAAAVEAAGESADEYQRYIVPGIQNLGNTCFFNAILQALASVSSFQEYLDEIVRQSKAKGQVRRIPFASALHDCIDGASRACSVPVVRASNAPWRLTKQARGQSVCLYAKHH